MARVLDPTGNSTDETSSNPNHESSPRNLLKDFRAIQAAAKSSSDGDLCAVAPSPELKERISKEIADIRSNSKSAIASLARAAEPNRPGFNDGLILPPDLFPLGTPLSAIRNAALDRAPLRGAVRVIVVLVDFSDKNMTQTQAHFRDLFFSTGVIPTGSVREYYAEVTHGLIDLQGDVVGPFRMPLTLAQYAHGASGIGGASPNAQTMARDAVIAADPTVNFTPFDNDGNGFVDAFIVVHAGAGGEQTGNPGDIWSHKWTLAGGAKTVDATKIFAYLTVPEDSRIGVCAHELGHLVLHGEYQELNRPAAEQEANRFAAAFLMPRSSVLAQGLRDASAARVLQAKLIWKVAAMALTHRLYELGLLTDWGYRSVCVQLSRLGYRRSEPDGIPRESSQLLSKVFRSIRDEGDTPAMIAAAIGIASDELQEHVFGLTLTTLTGGHHCSVRPARSGLHLVPPTGRR